MTLKDYYETLTNMIDKDTSLLDCEVIFSKETVGNTYYPVSWHPSVMYTDQVEYSMDARSGTDIEEEGESVDDYIKVVCLN